ncbi:MAG TPA: efflux RND transporter permease subunit [Cytophagaceae bacterium]
MNISSLSINRPVLATVLSIIILIFGVIGFTFLGVREFPSVDPPVVTVTTNYTGANADIIESQITEPLEESINGISGIRSLTSVSSDGRSTITVEFNLGIDMADAANDVRDRVSRAVRNLPQDADPPIVVKSDADAGAILSVTLQSDKRNLLELTEIGNNIFKERLQTIPGVSEIRIWGEKKYAMRLLIDPAKLSAYRLTPLDVRNALLAENVELPSGRIEGYRTELTVRTFGRLTTKEDFDELIIKEEEGRVVKLKDIGEAILAPENERSILKGNGGLPMIGIAVTPQAGSNHIEIADEFYRRLEQIKKEIPDDIKLGMALDTTINIRKGILEVEETIFIAFCLVVLVIFFFLRDWRTTLIPVIAIPISLIATFFIMYVAGFSINILTLLGIVLATGLVVDDAIVVLENIYHKIEHGMDPVQAGHEGSKEIFFAIISTTITLAAVFLPIIFLEGVTGRLFREFGVVVAGSVVVSAFVSLTLTPMLSAKWLKKKERTSAFYVKTEQFFNWLTNSYNGSLKSFMNNRWVAVVIMIISTGIIFIIGMKIPSELAPLEDKSRLQIMATAPEGTSYELMAQYIDTLIAIVDTLKEKESILSVTAPGFGASVSVNSGFVRLTLTPPDQREITQQQLSDKLTGIIRKYNFARTFVVQEQTIGGGRNSGLPVQYVIQAPTIEKLEEVIPEFMQKAQNSPVFEVVDLNLKFNKPEITIEIDRERARALGVTVMDIAQTLQLYFSGQRFGYFIMKGKQYQVIGQANRTNRDEPLDLKSIYVRNNKNELIQLDNLVKISSKSSPPQLYRYNRYVSATVSAATATGITLGQGIEEMDRIAAEVLDESFSTSLAGTAKEFAESTNSLMFAFLLALVLIYLILAAQFESYIDPLVIMFTVPMAIAGALLSLWFFDQTLNIFSQIGIIVLIGIVTKNGILIVEFANQRREEGLSVREAVIEAATQRLRPILMTSLATILGALPIAMAIGAASQSRAPMGIAIIGGLLFSLVLTLFVIPALYTYFTKDTKVKKEQDVLLEQ